MTERMVRVFYLAMLRGFDIRFLAFSGDNSLWLDEELNNGHSSSSQTFGNEPLVSSGDFTCSRVDVIAFVSEA